MTGETEIDLSGEYFWSRPTFTFLEANLTCNISVLNLSTCHIGSEGAALLADHLKNPSSLLQTLILNQSRVAVSSSILIFRSIPDSHLTELSLDGNYLNEDACTEFANILDRDPPLELVSFRKCDISSTSCSTIAAHLPNATHLNTLWLDNNSIFDKGADSLAANLVNSALTSLSIRGGQVWATGTTALLKAILASGKFTMIDLSDNIVELPLLSICLKESPSLTGVAISRCKVPESQVLPFLEELPQYGLTDFLLEGFNFAILPISWPRLPDTLWANGIYFDALMRGIIESSMLVDVRCGFWNLEQIHTLMDIFEQGRINRTMTVSLSDFGRSDCQWVIEFPELALVGPVSIFEWKTSISHEGAVFFGEFFKRATFQGDPLESIRISEASVTDEILNLVLSSFHEPVNLLQLDLSHNLFGDEAVNGITIFLMNSSVKTLNLMDTKLTAAGLQRLFSFLGESAFLRIPVSIEFSLISGQHHDSSTPALFRELGTLLGRNPAVEEIVIHGSVPPEALTALVSGLIFNSHLTVLKIVAPSEDVHPTTGNAQHELATATAEFVRVLHQVLTAEESQCVLASLGFNPLGSGLGFQDEVIELWGQIENILEENARKAGMGN
jgi:Ran GTPase-activating protein (RanGAP) involved in mRNA processing and transport